MDFHHRTFVRIREVKNQAHTITIIPYVLKLLFWGLPSRRRHQHVIL